MLQRLLLWLQSMFLYRCLAGDGGYSVSDAAYVVEDLIAAECISARLFSGDQTDKLRPSKD